MVPAFQDQATAPEDQIALAVEKSSPRGIEVCPCNTNNSQAGILILNQLQRHHRGLERSILSISLRLERISRQTGPRVTVRKTKMLARGLMLATFVYWRIGSTLGRAFFGVLTDYLQFRLSENRETHIDSNLSEILERLLSETAPNDPQELQESQPKSC